LLVATLAWGKKPPPPSQAELDAITARGKLLAEYDVAAWHATDAVLASVPRDSLKGTGAHYIACKTDAGWVVVWGRLNEQRDKLLIVYEAKQAATPVQFSVTKYDPPAVDTGYSLGATNALNTALQDFKGEQGYSYNAAVLPAPDAQFYVYVYPGSSEDGVYLLGGDVRYLISKDGLKVVERRQLHKSILRFDFSKPDGRKMEMGFHTHVLSDIPEDTDVFYVLARRPSVPEWVASKNYIYAIEPDGTIKCLGETDKVLHSK
jgi:hypothetical protein